MKKILRIPYTRVLELLAPIKGRPLEVLASGTIPEGSAVLAVHENHQYRSIDFTLQHESFPEVPMGTMLPVIEDLTWETVLQVPLAAGAGIPSKK